MLKKVSVILSILFCLFCISTLSFAVSSNDVKNTISNTTDTVVNGIDNLGKDVRNGVGAAENGIEGAVKDFTNNDNNNNNESLPSNSEYIATRTASDMTTSNNMGLSNSTLWTWLILAVVGIVIVALVWYYAVQPNDDNHN